MVSRYSRTIYIFDLPKDSGRAYMIFGGGVVPPYISLICQKSLAVHMIFDLPKDSSSAYMIFGLPKVSGRAYMIFGGGRL